MSEQQYDSDPMTNKKIVDELKQLDKYKDIDKAVLLLLVKDAIVANIPKEFRDEYDDYTGTENGFGLGAGTTSHYKLIQEHIDDVIKQDAAATAYSQPTKNAADTNDTGKGGKKSRKSRRKRIRKRVTKRRMYRRRR